MIAVLADSHLGQSPGGEEALLKMFARVRESRATALYLLGDIFQYLVGDSKFSTPLVQSFLEAVRELRRTGTRVHYVEGNREFFLRGSYLEPEFDAVGPHASFEAGGRRFFLVHGDGINERDWPYRFWRFLSKNSAARAAIRLVPAKVAVGLVSRAERRLRDTNFKHKERLPVDMIRSYAAGKIRAGFDVVLLGHFHEAWRSEVDGGQVEIVPPFLEERRWMEIDEAGRMSLAALA